MKPTRKCPITGSELDNWIAACNYGNAWRLESILDLHLITRRPEEARNP